MSLKLSIHFGKCVLKNELGATWVKIFYQKVEKEGDAFKTNEDALSADNNNQFSILLEASQWSHHGPYEFLLQYPEYSGYNRWKQTNFPLTENCTTSKQLTALITFHAHGQINTGVVFAGRMRAPSSKAPLLMSGGFMQ